MTEPTPLRLLNGEEYEYSDNYEIIEEVAWWMGIPDKSIDDLTGVVYEIVDGEYITAYFTESNRPFDLSTYYYEYTYWVDDDEEVSLYDEEW